MGRLGPGDLGAMGDDSAFGSSGGFIGAMAGKLLTLSLPWPGSTDCEHHASHTDQPHHAGASYMMHAHSIMCHSGLESMSSAAVAGLRKSAHLVPLLQLLLPW